MGVNRRNPIQEHHAAPDNEKAVYTSCVCNCGGTGSSVIKAHLNQSKVIQVKFDQTILFLVTYPFLLDDLYATDRLCPKAKEAI
jgi:hypothetical protein